MSGPTSWNAADARIVDTNLLLYAYDQREATKRPIARQLMSDLIRANRLCLPAQVLNEFFNTVTNKKKPRTLLPTLADSSFAAKARRREGGREGEDVHSTTEGSKRS